MFDRDKWEEIIQVLLQNKLRTFLTIFGIFWGMLMLMLMIGAGKGLENGVKASGIGSYATNSCFVYPQKTAVSYKGFPQGREYFFSYSDIEIIKEQLRNEIGLIVPVFNLQSEVIYENVESKTEIYGHVPDIMTIEPKKIIEGRFLNDRDIKECRKVAVIGKVLKLKIFQSTKSVVGKSIKIGGIYFKIIGVQTNQDADRQGKQHNETVSIPYSSLQDIFRLGNKVGGIAFTANEHISIASLAPKVISILKKRNSIALGDPQAIGLVNVEEAFLKIKKLFGGINALTWFVGFLTLLAGAIGISNIMLITVKERTKEIGIRRALGATPGMITLQIVTESVVLITFAGYLGMFTGITIIRLVDYSISNAANVEGFLNPEVSIEVSFLCLFILLFLGVLAGLIPANKALRIEPVVALKD